MKKKLLFVFIISTISSYAQDRIKFEYDMAGNQTERRVCINCDSSKIKEQRDKDVSKLNEEDLLKFSPNDFISYYPNPVIEELYLKWELINENNVKNIQLFSLTGQVLLTLNNLEKRSNTNISFQEYSKGTYIVVLNYTNGEQKSITIVKQ